MSEGQIRTSAVAVVPMVLSVILWGEEIIEAHTDYRSVTR
jgi:hypothetical protein